MKTKFQVMSVAASGVAFLVDSLDDQDAAIALCEKEARESELTHIVRKVTVETIHRTVVVQELEPGAVK